MNIYIIAIHQSTHRRPPEPGGDWDDGPPASPPSGLIVAVAATVALAGVVALAKKPAAESAYNANGCLKTVSEKECAAMKAKIAAAAQYYYDSNADEAKASASWSYSKLVEAINGDKLKKILMTGNFCNPNPKTPAERSAKHVCDKLKPFKTAEDFKKYKVLAMKYESIGKDRSKHEATVTPEQSKALQELLAVTKNANAIQVKLKLVDPAGKGSSTMEPWQWACTKAGHEKCQNACIYYYDKYGADEELLQASGLGTENACPISTACCYDNEPKN